MRIPDLSRKFHCNQCERETRHLPMARGRNDNKITKDTFEMYDVMRCTECYNIKLCIEQFDIPGPMMGDPELLSRTYYPPLSFRTKPNWYSQLNENYRLILDEVYSALDNSLYCLASTGTRTAIDQLIVEKVGDTGRFEDKIKALCDKGIIDVDEKDLLIAVIDAGSASAHRGFKPDDDDMNDMMKITEHIFYQVYIKPIEKKALSDKAIKLKNKTPKRK